MGVWKSTHVAYGVHVPKDKYQAGPWPSAEGDRLDRIIAGIGLKGTDVGHMTGGAYDRDELFLVCSLPYDRDNELTHVEIELGTWRSYPASWFASEQRREWDSLIRQVAIAAGYGDLGEPGWLVVPDES